MTDRMRIYLQELTGVLDQTLDQAYSSRNRVVAKVAAHLLVALPLQHLVDGRASGCSSGPDPTTCTRAALVEGESASAGCIGMHH